MYGPRLTGPNFVLRPPRLEEAEAMCAWFTDLEVTARAQLRYPPSLEMEREWLAARATDPAWILWAIDHEDRLVGVTSISAIDWANGHGTTGTMIGDKSAWGRGIAGGVMRLRAEYAFTETTLRKLISGYIEGNEASRRAQMKAGYREVAREREHYYRDGRWLDHFITELLKEDWER